MEDLNQQVSALNIVLKENQEKVKMMAIALDRSQVEPGELDHKIHELDIKLKTMKMQLSGDPIRAAVGEKSKPTIGRRISVAAMGTRNSTYGPSQSHRKSLAIAEKQIKLLKLELKQVIEVDIPALLVEMKVAKAPFVKGSKLD